MKRGKTMNRREMYDWTQNVVATAEITDDYWRLAGKEMFWDILMAASKWRVGKHVNVAMNGAVLDGVLYINGEAIKRVAPKMPRKYSYSTEAAYWEGKILERQETY
jgi:hypothetical protein